VVTSLERRYPRYDGLNLAWETLEGLVKHNGPLTGELPFGIAEYAAVQDLWLHTHAGGEAQAAAIADDIAYDTHDVDDGLRAGLLTLDSLADLPLIGDILRAIHSEYPGLAAERIQAELIRRMITAMVEDAIAESARRIAALAPASSDDIRAAGHAVIGFSAAMAAADREIKARLRHDVYRHRQVMAVMERAESVVARLFTRYRDDPLALPESWRPRPGGDAARTAADFLAGMTDRYALLEHARFFGVMPELR
jgi:dGTPase